MDVATEPQAFGAGRGGSSFDLIEFLKRPQVILRIIAWVITVTFDNDYTNVVIV